MTNDGPQQPRQLLEQAAGPLRRVLAELRARQQDLQRVVTNPTGVNVDPATPNGHIDYPQAACGDGLDHLHRVLNAGQALADTMDAAALKAANEAEGG